MTEKASSFESFKRSPFSSTKHSTYFEVYDKVFDQYVGEKITLVEVGVLNGGSLFMWRDFFGDQARIIGIDLNPAAKRWEKEGFEIFIGSQSDLDFWKNFIEAVGKIDILLDDGGHTYEQQIVTVESILPAINDGGLIVVEDTHTSYLDEFGSSSNKTFIAYAKNIVDGVNYRFGLLSERKPERTIYSVAFYESFVVFEVSRKKASRVSTPIDNGSRGFNAEDLRDEDFTMISTYQEVASSLKWMGELPIIGVLLKLANKTIKKLILNTHNSKLSKYFKY